MQLCGSLSILGIAFLWDIWYLINLPYHIFFFNDKSPYLLGVYSDGGRASERHKVRREGKIHAAVYNLLSSAEVFKLALFSLAVRINV